LLKLGETAGGVGYGFDVGGKRYIFVVIAACVFSAACEGGEQRLRGYSLHHALDLECVLIWPRALPSPDLSVGSMAAASKMVA
jgi:hypothetical protein